MKMLWKAGIVGALILGVTTTWAQDDKFKVYGFADFTFSQWMDLSDSSFLNAFGEKAPSATLGNVNLYFDMKPNDFTRAFVEVNMNTTVFNKGETGRVDTRVKVELPDGTPVAPEDLTKGTGTDTRGSTTGGILLERAWFDLFLLEQVNLRVGKFITPAGIWNVDHGSPIITPVSQPNQTSFFAIFPEAQAGLMVYGAKYIGDHELSYNVYTSAGRNDTKSIVGEAEIQEMEKLSDLAFGGHVAFAAEEIIDQLKVGASAYTGVLQDETRILENVVTVDATNPTGAPLIRQYYYDDVNYALREFCYGIDLKASHMNVNFQSEVNMRKVEVETGTNPGKSTDFLGYYFLLSYDVALLDYLSVTPYAMWEHIGWEEPQNTPEFIGLHTTPIAGWDQYIMGLNFALHTNYHVKIEYALGSLEETDVATVAEAAVFDSDDMDFSVFQIQFSMAF
ncbi:MAG: hypothetical protein OCC49_09140 [Fibrobacterales bacterium]